jgi:hypothetical protein
MVLIAALFNQLSVNYLRDGINAFCLNYRKIAVK